MSTETRKKTGTPETAVWYFIGATFAFALGPSLFSGGESLGWQAILFNVLGIVAFVCGCVVFIRELRLRKEAKKAVAQETRNEGESSQERDSASSVK